MLSGWRRLQVPRSRVGRITSAGWTASAAAAGRAVAGAASASVQGLLRFFQRSSSSSINGPGVIIPPAAGGGSWEREARRELGLGADVDEDCVNILHTGDFRRGPKPSAARCSADLHPRGRSSASSSLA